MCFSIQMSGGSGFEAFFTAEAVLVVSVFSKKERNDIPVMDCPIVCNKWVCVEMPSHDLGSISMSV